MMQPMKNILHGAYANPNTGGVYYSANSAEPVGKRLSGIPFWDWTPVPTRGVDGASTCLFALGMGCEPTETSDGRPWIRKLITDPAQVRDMDVPDIHSGQAGVVLRNLREMVGALPPGELVRCCDVQSPLGVAELMWDSSFYVALIEHSEAVHDLLDKITNFIIAFMQEYQLLAGARLNPCGFPCLWAEGPGTMIADDTMSLVSPEMHLEFSVPYLNRIADACGPIYYHSCTWREPYFDNIHQVRNVITYNWACGDSVDFGIIAREFGGKAMLAPHLVIDMHREKGALTWGRNFADEFDFFKYMVESTPDDAAMYFWFSNIREKGEIMERIYDWLHARGHTPQAQGL
jgi:hypothetical protein